METYRFRIVLINYLKNLCNLRNLWIKYLFGCGFAAQSQTIPKTKINVNHFKKMHIGSAMGRCLS